MKVQPTIPIPWRGLEAGVLPLLALLCLVAFTPLSSGAQTIAVSRVSGDGLSQVWLDVTLLTEGATIAATQNDISYDGQNTTVIGCVKNDDLDKDISYAFYPGGGICRNRNVTASGSSYSARPTRPPFRTGRFSIAAW